MTGLTSSLVEKWEHLTRAAPLNDGLINANGFRVGVPLFFWHVFLGPRTTLNMLDFFRLNCSWYISGITKGNDRSQSIPSRAYDLWPARPFVIVVVDHTIPHKHISIRWIIVSSILMSSSSAASFFRSFSSEWKSWSSKQCSYLMNQKKDKSLKVGSSHLLVILDIYGKLH